METIEPQLLDACGLINACASGQVTEISAFFRGLSVVEDVAAEAVGSVVVAGAAVQILALNDIEVETFVALASIDGMDAGEAASFAAAVHRTMPVVTDDRRAIRVARDQLAEVRINSTPMLIRAYAEGVGLEDEVVRDLIQAIEGEASFIPAAGGVDVDWWERYRTI
jgi:predicted nucleic acid-binding protein